LAMRHEGSSLLVPAAVRDLGRFSAGPDDNPKEPAFGRAKDDGWNSNGELAALAVTEMSLQAQPEVVASAWRVLREPYGFPAEDAYRTRAEDAGRVVTSRVGPEDGGYRYDLILEPAENGPKERPSETEGQTE